MKTVFVAMSADIFHTGHLNIIKVARELGDVIVGLGTDEVNAQYKQMALMSYEQRKAIIENIKGVTRVIPQPSLDLVPNLRSLKPDYVVHGDDWKTGLLRETRQGVIDVLKEWDGQLVEPPYTSGISSTDLRAAINSAISTPEMRSRQLHRLFKYMPFVRIMEVYSGLTAAIADKARIPTKKGQAEFDLLWLGAEGEALLRGIPYAEFVDHSSQLRTVQDILNCTRKPVVVELKTTQSPKRLAHDISQLERVGASGVVISVPSEIADLRQLFYAGKKATVSEHFVLIVAIGTIHLKYQVAKILDIAKTMVQYGADALFITSSSETIQPLKHFFDHYNQLAERLPIVLSLTNYSGSELELNQLGIQAVVYRNNLLAAACNAMTETAVSILQKSEEVAALSEDSLSPIYTLLNES